MNKPTQSNCTGCLASFPAMLENKGLDLDSIQYLISQGIEMEKLNLEVQRCTDQESIDSRIRIMNGERLLFFISVSRPC